MTDLGDQMVVREADYGKPLAADRDRPPEKPSLRPGEWMRKNLFASPLDTVLSILGVVVALFVLRGLLNFVFSEVRNWSAVRTNLRLFLTHAYPEEQYTRIWVTFGTIVILAGFTVGMWARWGVVPLKRVAGWLMATGGLVIAGAVLREPSVLTDAAGESLVDPATNTLVRESFLDAMADRQVWWIIAAVLMAVGLGIWLLLGPEGRRTRFVSITGVLAAGAGLIIGSLWVVRYGHNAFADGIYIKETGVLVAASTRIPWTVMWFLLVGAYVVGRYLRSVEPERKTLRLVINLAWLTTPFVQYWLVLRDPDFDYSHVLSTDLPMAVGFAVIGGVILWWLTQPGIGEMGRIAATLLMFPVALSWISAFFGWYSMLQKARLSLLLLLLAALLAPNFVGVLKLRRQFVVVWVLAIGAFHYLVTAINSPSTIETPTSEFVGGLTVTVLVAVMTLLFSFPLGILLALARTSKLPLFRVMSTTFIEVIRGVPLITIFIFFSIVLNLFLPTGIELGLLAAATLGYTLFSAATLAENIRGGLQSVSTGQVEAAKAVGLNTTQRVTFVVLPQALRASIPALVGQVISVFKETSLLAIIGLFDFLRIATATAAQPEFLGAKREGLLFVSAVYWVITFAMSKYSQRLERQQGLGER